MKHILSLKQLSLKDKSFLESESYQYYYEIPNFHDLEHKLILKNGNKFTSDQKKVINRIKDSFPNSDVKTGIPGVDYPSINYCKDCVIIFGGVDPRITLHIYTYTDEWYYIKYMKKTFGKHDWIIEQKFYKCDQWTGLVKFLKDNNFIN